MRQQTDRIMSIGWIILPLISVVIGVVSIGLAFVRPLAGVALTVLLDFVVLILYVVFW